MLHFVIKNYIYVLYNKIIPYYHSIELYYEVTKNDKREI